MRPKRFQPALFSLVFVLLLSLSGPLWAENDGLGPEVPSEARFETEVVDLLSKDLRVAWRELDEIRHAAENSAEPWARDRLTQLSGHLELLESRVWRLDDQELIRKHTELARLAQAMEQDMDHGTVSAHSGERPQGLALGAHCLGAPEVAEGAWALQWRAAGRRAENRAMSGWLRFQAPFEGRFTLQTRRSNTDTRLEVYADCGAAPIAQSDDAYGLAAALSFLSAESEVWWIRVQAQGRGISVLDFQGLSTEQKDYLRRSRAAEKAAGPVASVRSVERSGPQTQLGSGILSGRVTAQADGTSLQGIRVELYQDEGYWQYQGYATSDEHGAYGFSGLEAGEYRVATNQYFPESDYLNQVYPGAECVGVCDIEDGESIELDGVSEVSGIDFALLRGSKISGWVRDESQVGIASVRVEIFGAGQVQIRSDYTDSAGRYSVGGLAAGDYRLKAESSAYRDELWQDVNCQGGCDLSAGDVLILGSEQDVQGIDFELIRLGSVSGRITDELTGEPISFGSVTAYNAGGSWMGSGGSDAQGEYSIRGLPAGDYYLVAEEGDYVDEAWGDVVCEPCDPTTSTPVAVVHNADTSGLDFALQPYGSLTGRITSATDDRPLGNLWVEVYDGTGELVRSVRSYGDGNYELILPAGSYFVAVPDVHDHDAEVWNDQPCIDGICDVSAGDPVVVNPGTETPDIEFSLTEKARISGVVTASSDGSPLTGWMWLYDGSGQLLHTAYLNGLGEYRVVGLEAGTYYLKATSSGYVAEIYDDVPCAPDCDPSTGLALVVTEGQHLQGIDFALDRLGRVFGAVTDLETGLPLGDYDTRITFYDEVGDYFDQLYPNAAGSYSNTHIPPGTYYLRVTRHGYIGRLWQSVDCFPASGDDMCDVTTGTPIVITGNSEIEANVALDRGGSISGTVSSVSSVSSASSANSFLGSSADGAFSMGGDSSVGGITAQVWIYDDTGAFITSQSTTIPGSWSLSGLITGNYFVKTTIYYPRYMDELWDSIPCEADLGFDCDVTTGSPVAVTRGSETSGIDFTLDVVGTISGRLTQSGTGEPIRGQVYAYDSAGSVLAGTYSDAEGYYTLEGLGAGDFYVSTRFISNHMDWVYGGGMCESDCEPLSGTPLSLTLYQQLNGIDFSLEPSRIVRGTVTSLSSGAPIPGVAIDFWRSDGSLWSSSVTGPDGSYENQTLSNGTYYISTDNGSGFVDQIWSGVSCPDGSAHQGLCDVIFQGTLIEVGEEHPVRVIPFDLANSEVLFHSGFENGLLGWTVFP